MLESDAENVVLWRNREDINQWFFSNDHITREDHLYWYHSSRKNRLDYMIVYKENSLPIGTVSFKNIDKVNRTAEAGKLIGDITYRGRGLAKEAFYLWINYGFEHLKLDSIYIKTYANNTANIKVNESLGFEVCQIERFFDTTQNVERDVFLMQLKKYRIIFRKVNLSDAKMILEWRNDEMTRMGSLSHNIISEDEHMSWLASVLASDKNIVLLAEVGKEPRGVLYFAVDGAIVEVSIHLRPGFWGKGLGSAILRDGLVWLKNTIPMVNLVVAKIIPNNIASIKIFESQGFSLSCFNYHKEI